MKDLSLHILDIVQNSISAGANLIQIAIRENPGQDSFLLTITDDGKGMDKAELEKVTDPFYTSRTTRKVGLGIPLLKLNAERAGGELVIQSEPGKGTRIEAWFQFSHIDRIPSGDLAGTISLLVSANPSIEFIYSHTTARGEYIFSTKEVKEVLGDIPISESSVYPLIKELISTNLKEIEA